MFYCFCSLITERRKEKKKFIKETSKQQVFPHDPNSAPCARRRAPGHAAHVSPAAAAEARSCAAESPGRRQQEDERREVGRAALFQTVNAA